LEALKSFSALSKTLLILVQLSDAHQEWFESFIAVGIFSGDSFDVTKDIRPCFVSNSLKVLKRLVRSLNLLGQFLNSLFPLDLSIGDSLSEDGQFRFVRVENSLSFSFSNFHVFNRHLRGSDVRSQSSEVFFDGVNFFILVLEGLEEGQDSLGVLFDSNHKAFVVVNKLVESGVTETVAEAFLALTEVIFFRKEFKWVR